MKTKKIAIIGASIAGSAVTIVLQRLGYSLSVFERSKSMLQDRGAGIMLSHQLITQLQQRDLIDANFPLLNTKTRDIYIYDSKQAKGRVLTTHPLVTAATHWQTLYLNLIKRVPKNIIRYNSTITGIKQLDHSVELTVNERDVDNFDFVICADGYDSIGRKSLFPSLQLEFSNCIIWRGTLSKIDPQITEYLLNNVAFHAFENGLMILYLIPKINTDNPESDYIVNWAIYEKITDKHPLHHKSRRIQNISKHEMTPALLDYLHQMMVYFPHLPRLIVLETQDPFIQAIYDVAVPHYVVKNICLLGDAAALLRPHVASGATKALQDAIALSESVKHNDDFMTALKEWDKTQRQSTQQLFHLGRRIGDLLVLKAPNWQTIKKEQIDSYWENTIAGYEWYAVKK